jgi:hypothetical protein
VSCNHNYAHSETAAIDCLTKSEQAISRMQGSASTHDGLRHGHAINAATAAMQACCFRCPTLTWRCTVAGGSVVGALLNSALSAAFNVATLKGGLTGAVDWTSNRMTCSRVREATAAAVWVQSHLSANGATEQLQALLHGAALTTQKSCRGMPLDRRNRFCMQPAHCC